MSWGQQEGYKGYQNTETASIMVTCMPCAYNMSVNTYGQDNRLWTES